MQGKRLEPLGGGLEIYTAPACPVTTDSLLLAGFAVSASGRRPVRAADLGTGNGILPLLWSREPRFTPIVGVEIQPALCRLARESVEYNRLSGRIQIICADIRFITGILPRETFDLVSCNPPYYQLGAGKKSADTSRLAARSEENCSLDGAVQAAAALLRYGGRLCMCHRPERLCDLLEAMRRHGVEPKVVQLVQHRAGQRPKFVLACGKKGGKPGLDIWPTRVLTEEETATRIERSV